MWLRHTSLTRALMSLTTQQDTFMHSFQNIELLILSIKINSAQLRRRLDILFFPLELKGYMYPIY